MTPQELAELWNVKGYEPRAKAVIPIVSIDYPATKTSAAFTSLACVEVELETPTRHRFHRIPLGVTFYDETELLKYLVKRLKD